MKRVEITSEEDLIQVNLGVIPQFHMDRKNITNMSKIVFFIAGTIVFTLLSLGVLANYNYGEINLQGRWNFSIGDDIDWASPKFNDSDWEKIYVPSRWEEQGYQGYNGYAWYRRDVSIPTSYKNRQIVLELGYIDDVDEVFFNGVKIGQSGSFPPYFSTAYNAFRKYVIPSNLIRFDENNTIAVRTYDAQLEGGIVRGNVKLVAGEITILPDIDMCGTWDFKTRYSSDKSTTIIVPGQWENQGFYNYDGLAVYSKEVDIPANLASKKLVFMAGRIDDDDQLIINGKLVGQTGDINRNNNTDMHREFRNYFIPDGIIKPGKNLIEIKVRDRGGEGGILEGNIGIITQENFIKYWRMKRQHR